MSGVNITQVHHQPPAMSNPGYGDPLNAQTQGPRQRRGIEQHAQLRQRLNRDLVIMGSGGSHGGIGRRQQVSGLGPGFLGPEGI